MIYPHIVQFTSHNNGKRGLFNLDVKHNSPINVLYFYCRKVFRPYSVILGQDS
jgi:hypothetical protein